MGASVFGVDSTVRFGDRLAEVCAIKTRERWEGNTETTYGRSIGGKSDVPTNAIN